MNQILSIRGKQGSGKTTLMEMIIKMLNDMNPVSWNENFIFAGTIYKMHAEILPILKKLGVISEDTVKLGTLLQVLGEWGRTNIDPDVWCMTCRKEVDLMFRDTNCGNVRAIVSDTRMPNEFHYFPDALRISLEAPEPVRKARCPNWRDNTNHPSEIGLDEYAARGYFDMTFDTETLPTEFVAQVVVEKLLKADWLVGRKEEVVQMDVEFWNKRPKKPDFLNSYRKGETLYEARL